MLLHGLGQEHVLVLSRVLRGGVRAGARPAARSRAPSRAVARPRRSARPGAPTWVRGLNDNQGFAPGASRDQIPRIVLHPTTTF